MSSLGWTELEPALQLVLLTLGRMAGQQQLDQICVREFVFPSHPLINCYVDFCGLTLHVMKL